MDTISFEKGATAVALKVRQIIVDVELKTVEIRYETLSDAGVALGQSSCACNLADAPVLDGLVADLMNKTTPQIKEHADQVWASKTKKDENKPKEGGKPNV